MVWYGALVAALCVAMTAVSAMPKGLKSGGNILTQKVKNKIPLTPEIIADIEKRKKKETNNLRGIKEESGEPIKTHVLKGSANLEYRNDITKITRVHGKEYHSLMFAVKKKNLDKIKSIAHDVSDPQSSKYGKHISKEEVMTLTHNPDAVREVIDYLTTFDTSIVIDDITINSDYIHVRAPVEVWERMFHTEFNHYKITHHDDSVDHVIRTEKYSLPTEISSHVTGVFATTDMPLPKKKTHMSSAAEQKVINEKIKANAYDPTMLTALQFVYPDVINAAYNIDSNIGSSSVSQAIYASLDQEYSTVDLKNFLTFFNIPTDSVDEVTSHQTKYCPDGNDCAESNLDVQYMMGISQQTPMTYYYTNKWWSWLSVVANMTNPPDLFSISYGAEEYYMTSMEMDIFDEEAMILATMGVTLLAASGDDGAPGSSVKTAYSCQYSPEWPASSQYVTAVGATQGPEAGKAEVACSGATNGVITTGGGFSNYFETPTFQQSFVDSYLTNNSPFHGFNRNGRGYPDVAVMGRNYLIALSSTELYPVYTGLFGTSASSPTFGAMISLVNSARVTAGKSKIGWLNPALYYLKSTDTSNVIFNDITAGNNNCNVYGVVCCEQGFTAVTGWDPATGLGSIDFVNFKAAMLALGDMGDDDMATTLAVPTVLPTTYTASNSPSSVPTYAPGFVSLITYNPNDDDCTAVAPLIQTYTQGVCIPLYDTQGQQIRSGMWTCNGNGELIETVYSNAECEHPISQDIFYEGCSYQAILNTYYSSSSYGSSYYGSSSSTNYADDDWGTEYYYANMPNMTYGADDVGYNFNYTPYSISCSYSGVTDADYDLPAGSVYTLFREYASTDKSCDESALSTYTAYSNDACIYYGHGYYLQFDGLIVKFYFDSECTEYTLFSVVLGSNCVSEFDDDTSSYYYSSSSSSSSSGGYYSLTDTINSNWFVWPTMVDAPTVKPTVRPTKATEGNSADSHESGLSTGGKAAIGVVFGLLGIAGIAYGFYYFNQRKKTSLLVGGVTSSTENPYNIKAVKQ